MNTLVAIISAVIYLLTFLWWVIMVQVVLSWLVAFNVLNLSSPFVRSLANALDRLTAPLYRPLRRLLPDFGGLDLSPLVVLLLIMVVQKVLGGVAMDIATSAA